MREAVIASTARTPIGKAFRGAFNNTHGAKLGGHVVEHAVIRSGIAGEEVEDVIFGCGFPEGAPGVFGKLIADPVGGPAKHAAFVLQIPLRVFGFQRLFID